MSAAQDVVRSDLVTVLLAVLNVAQVVLLAHISSRSTRVRQSDREPGPDGP